MEIAESKHLFDVAIKDWQHFCVLLHK